MTFSYINFRFHLHENYLKDKLSIDDNRYPNLSIKRYIKKNNIDNNEFLEKVRTAILSESMSAPLLLPKNP